MKSGLTKITDQVKNFGLSRDNFIPSFEVGEMDSDIRGRALALYGLEIAGVQEKSDFRKLCGDHPDAVYAELEQLRKGKSARVKILYGKWWRASQKYSAFVHSGQCLSEYLSEGYRTALMKFGEALVRECDTFWHFMDFAEDAGWFAREAVPVEEIGAARARLAAENAPSVRVEFVNPVQVEGVRAVVENTAPAALAAKKGAQEARRTRETVEQKGAAVAGAIDALGAKFEAVGDEVREQGEATRETVRGEAAATRAELEKYGVESVESLKSALAEIRQQSTALDSDAKGMALLEAQTAAFKAWREFQLASNGKIEMPRKMALRLSMFQKWGDTNGRMQWGQVVQSVTLSRFTQMWKSYERRH